MVIGGCAYLSEKQGELIFRPARDAWWGFNGANYSFDEHWIAVGAIILLGMGIVTGVKNTRQKDPPS